MRMVRPRLLLPTLHTWSGGALLLPPVFRLLILLEGRLESAETLLA